MSWKDSVNQAIGIARLADVTAYVRSATDSRLSAIDRCYDHIRLLNSIANPTALLATPELGQLVFLGLISATENYFREVMASTLRICGLAKQAASDHTVKWGSVLWHQGNNVEISAFENSSFASSNEIKKSCRNFLAFSIQDSSPLITPLEEFDRLCEIRHSVVHANGYIAGKNAVVLNLPPTTTRIRASLGFQQLQESALICTSLATTFNSQLFALIGKRWAIEWRTKPDWNPANENSRFEEIWNLFHSAVDSSAGLIQFPMTIEQCRDAIKLEFGI